MTINVFVYMGGDQEVPWHVTHIRVHKSVKTIRARAFENCIMLVSIEMHDGVGIIEEHAFAGCYSLRGIKLSGVRVIEYAVFCNCTALEDVEFGDKLETIGSGAFANSVLRNIKLSKVRVIGINAFYGCEQLTEAELSKDLETIEDGAFCNCPRLRRVALPLKANLLGNNVFYGCGDLSQVDLVGGINKTISSLLLDSWKNEMNNEIDRINQVLPNTPTDEKTAVIQQWMERVLERIDYYKSERASDDGVMGDTTMDGASVDQSEESNQQDDPKEQAADNSFGEGDQNDNFHTDPLSDVSSEKGRQSDAKSTKGSEEESEIQRLKAQLKESESKAAALEERLKEIEEENSRLKKKMKYSKECVVIDLDELEEAAGEVSTEEDHPKSNLAVLKRMSEVKQEAIERAETAKTEAQAFKEKLADMERKLKLIELRHGPTDSRQVKEKLMECLRNHKVKVGRSRVDSNGVGAIAMVDILEGTRLFHFNGAPTDKTIELSEDDIEDLPLHVQGVVKMYTIPDPDNGGVRHVPKNGFSFALGVSWYINSVDGTGLEPNVGVGPGLDESGFDELVATQHIKAGEELLLGYKLSDTLLGQQLPENK
jgi:hypothetical protein